jgi:TatA/E family protein of Tat protein translocase
VQATQVERQNIDNLGSQEILIILVIAFIVFGPRKLRETGNSLGKGIAEFKKATRDLAKTWENEAALELKPESPPAVNDGGPSQ